ncbi:uncharacterized protein LOC129920704 [Episyrphus balteatus]|uniref:uncharacterized protein LOC129920704 n=1 Tax=Episyrphus balteatus TaxID=286459 RepID=UPI0024859E43|nr:uncharacterized protein LOC129920704 [Episyrphus balteatus]
MNYCHFIYSIFCLINIRLLSGVCGKAIQEDLKSEELNKTHFGYKWVPLKTGDKLPENIIFIPRSMDRYIGRARHFDEILPAEITSDGLGYISSCHIEIQKDQFEILTTTGGCKWNLYDFYEGFKDTILRVGTARNGEPIYIGRSGSSHYIYHLHSLYLTNTTPYVWIIDRNRGLAYPFTQYLSCDVQNKWIDTWAKNLPNNSVSGGKSEDDYDIYVARVKIDCDVVTGQAIPDIGIARAIKTDNGVIESDYCQVLVGEPNEYTWVSAKDGIIPEYAVVHGKNGLEVSYVARFNKTIGHLTHSEALEKQLAYEILVKNQ